MVEGHSVGRFLHACPSAAQPALEALSSKTASHAQIGCFFYDSWGGDWPHSGARVRVQPLSLRAIPGLQVRIGTAVADRRGYVGAAGVSRWTTRMGFSDRFTRGALSCGPGATQVRRSTVGSPRRTQWRYLRRLPRGAVLALVVMLGTGPARRIKHETAGTLAALSLTQVHSLRHRRVRSRHSAPSVALGFLRF